MPYSSPVPANGAYNATIPGWGTGQLIALVSAHVLSYTPRSNSSSIVDGLTSGALAATLVLEDGTLSELTDSVSPDGLLTHAFPSATDGQSYRLFAFYQKHTLTRNLAQPKPITKTIFDNGSFTVDHYSARGAKTVTDFWERYILINGTKELLMQVGNSGKFLSQCRLVLPMIASPAESPL